MNTIPMNGPFPFPPGHVPKDNGRAAMLLGGCYSEAMAANMVAGCVDNLRSCLSESFHPIMIALANEIRRCGAMLLRLHNDASRNPGRVPTLLDYLDIFLPCFNKSVKDIQTYYEDNTKTKEIRWRTMYHKMTDEAGGIELPQRFSLCHQFLFLLDQMLTRHYLFDMNALEVLQNRVRQLREKQGIKPPQPTAGPLIARPTMAAVAFRDKSAHWAQDIFSRPLPSRTPLKNLDFSECYGPWTNRPIFDDTKVLFRRTFDQDRLIVYAYWEPSTNDAHMLIRSVDLNTNIPAFSIIPVQNLRIRRDGNSLSIWRWKLILFHCTFVALKFDGLPRGSLIHPTEWKISREKRLFQGAIHYGKTKHSLHVYEDIKSGSLRLYVSVWSGEFRYRPVWTAFITRKHLAPNWLFRKGVHRVYLRDLEPYVFSDHYRIEYMRQNKYNAFELIFVEEEAPVKFKEVFFPPIPTMADSNATESTVPSDDGDRTPDE